LDHRLEDKQFDEGHAQVMAELAVFAGLAMRMIAPTKELKEAVEQPETLDPRDEPRVNLLAITSSIVSMTGQTAATPKDMTDAVLGRLNALAQSHALIRRQMSRNKKPQIRKAPSR
jgi:hypothetical protein